MEGLCKYETKFLFHVQTKNGVKKIPKKDIMFEINNNKGKIIVKGNLLVANSEERIKFKVE